MEASKLIKFNSKIISYTLRENTKLTNTDSIYKDFIRPEALSGTTYKIKPPTASHAIYVTINDAEINGKVQPYEIFLRTKNPEHLMWTDALTLVISNLFRKGGDINFISEQLKDVFDTKGGYRKKGGKWSNSIVADIGEVIDRHLNKTTTTTTITIQPKLKTVECFECRSLNTFILDGCLTCLDCGYSKCN